jgi:glycosyltransferase involved in cell wall biosynthesis
VILMEQDRERDFATAPGDAGTSIAPQRIAVIASYAPSLTNFRLELLRRMVGAGHMVTAYAPENDAVVRQDLAAIGVDFVAIPMARTGTNPLQDFATFNFLLRCFRQTRPDVVIPYTMKPIIYGGLAARLAGVKRRYFLVTGLGYVFSDAGGATAKRRLVRTISVALYRRAFAGAGVVFAYNDADADDIARYRMLKRGKFAEIVPGSGVDLVHFARSEVMHRKPVFLLVARLLRDKGVYDYVEAARIVRRTDPDAEFRILGPFDPNPEGISRRQLQSWVDQGLVRYLGETRDVRPFLRDCSVFVLPSFYREGIPRSILEALSTGRAVITTDLPGCRNTVVEGWNGFLVQPNAPDEIARAMLRFSEDPELAGIMGCRSRELAASRFDVHHVNRLLLGRMGLIAD